MKNFFKKGFAVVLACVMTAGSLVIANAADGPGGPGGPGGWQPGGGGTVQYTEYPDEYTREALAEGLKMTQQEQERTVQAIINTLVADEDIDAIYSLLAGNNKKTAVQGNPGYATGLPELGVPESYYHDGPAGVTSIYETTGFPVNMSLGATFSTDMAYNYGAIEGFDNKTIGSNFQLGTQMDVARTGHWNRTKDVMGEDPYLTAILGTEQVKGVQDQGVAAMIKHFTGYGTNGDTGVNVKIAEQTMHEFYVTSFEYCIKYGNAASVMTTYNSIQVLGQQEVGEFTDNNRYLQFSTLRDIVGFDGMICCDWGGQKMVSVTRGNTMSMPSAGNNTRARIEQAIEDGLCSFDTVLDAAAANLTAYGKVGYLYYSFQNIYQLNGEDRVKRDKNRDIDDADTAIELIDSYDEDYTVEYMDHANDVVEQIAEKGAVLLKNENDALPLTSDDYTGGNSVALIGIGGIAQFTGTGAERSYGVVNYIDSPYEAIEKIVGENANITTEVGLDLLGETIPSEYIYQTVDGDENGWVRTYGAKAASGGWGPPGAGGGSSSDDDELPPYEPGPDGTGVFASSDIWAANGITNESVFVQDNTYYMVKEKGDNTSWYELTDVAGIDEVIDFTAGIHADGRRDFYNADEADAVQKGNAITDGEAYTWTGYLEVPQDGNYKFILQSIGGSVSCKIYDEEGKTSTSVSSGAGDRQGAQWGWNNVISSREGMGVGNAVSKTLEAGKRYKIVISGIDLPTSLADLKDLQIRLSWIPEGKDDANYNAAVEAAANNDKVVFFAWQNTTGNSATRALPSDQLKLMKDVINAAKANGNEVIVVLNTASSISVQDSTYFTEGLGWVDDVDAVMEMWFAGQAGGTATAKLLLGEANPSGKLPMTFHISDNDTSISYSDDAFKIATGTGLPQISNEHSNRLSDATVAEGIYMGYRWYDQNDNAGVAFDFGYGLSYTSFEYSDFKVTKTEGVDYGYDVTVTVTNTGDTAGEEVVQVYLGEADVPDGIQSAKVQLVGFDRTKELQPGESETVTIQVAKRQLSYWNSLQDYYFERKDGTMDKWVVASGERSIYAGSSSDNLIFEETVNVEPEDNAIETSAGKTFDISYSFSQDDIVGFYLYNENGGRITIKETKSEANSGNSVKWTVSASVATEGARTLSLVPVSASEGILDAIEVKVNVEPAATPGTIINAGFKKAAIKKNAPVGLDVHSASKVTSINVLNEKGNKMGKTLDSKVLKADGTIDWSYSVKIGTVGDREFSVIANNNAETSTPVSIIVVQ